MRYTYVIAHSAPFFFYGFKLFIAIIAVPIHNLFLSLFSEMLRNYVRKTERQTWSTESMVKAISVVQKDVKEMDFKKAAQQFAVPKTTLERYVKKKKENPDFVIDKTSGKYKCVFNKQQELELADYLKSMEKILFGLTMIDFRKLAFQLAEINGCSHRFNQADRMAGQDWMNSFFIKTHRFEHKKT